MSATSQKSGFPWWNNWWIWWLVFIVVYYLLFIFGLVEHKVKYSRFIDLFFSAIGMIVINRIWRLVNGEQLALIHEERQRIEVIRERSRRVEAAKNTFYHLTGNRYGIWSFNMYDIVSLQVYKPIGQVSYKNITGFEEINPVTIPEVSEWGKTEFLLSVWLIVLKYESIEEAPDDYFKPEAERKTTKITRTAMGLGWRRKDYWTIRGSGDGTVLCDRDMFMIPISTEVDKKLLFSFIANYRSVIEAGFDSIVKHGLPELDPPVEPDDPRGYRKGRRILRAAVQRVAEGIATGLVVDRSH